MSVKKVTVEFVANTKGIEKAGKGFDNINKDIKRSTFLVRELETQIAVLGQRRRFAKTEKELKGFNRQLEKAEREMARLNKVGRKGDGVFGGLSKTFGKLGPAIIAGLSVGAVIAFGRKLNETAVRMEAFEKRAATVFGNSIKIIQDFAKENAKALGLTENQFLGASAAIGDLLVPLGFARKRSAEMSVELVKLGGALKEFTGDQRSASQISDIVARALTGEVESLKRLGVNIALSSKEFKASVKNKEENLGLTQQQAKAETIFELALSQSTDALAAFENSEDSLVRQQAELSANTAELTERLAKAFTPVLLQASKALNFLTESVTNMDKGFSGLESRLEGIPRLLRDQITETDRQLFGLGKMSANLQDVFEKIENFRKAQNRAKKETEEGNAVTEDQIVTLKSLKEELKEANKEFEETEVNTKGFITAGKRVDDLKARIKKLTTATKKTEKAFEAFALTAADRLILLNNRFDESGEAFIENFGEDTFGPTLDNTEQRIKDFNANIVQDTINQTLFLVDAITTLIDQNAINREQKAQASLERESEAESRELNKRFSQGLITESKFNAAKFKLEEELRIKTRQAEIQASQDAKNRALVTVAISLATEIASIAVNAAANPANAITAGAAGLTQFALLSGIAIARSGIQTAIIAGQPISSFAEGTKDAPGGLSIVGEKGQEAMFVPQHAKILPAVQTSKYSDVFDAMYANKFDELYVPRTDIIERATSENMAANFNINGLKYSDKMLRGDVKEGNKIAMISTDLIVNEIRKQNDSKRLWT